MRSVRLFIDGAWLDGQDVATTLDPSTGRDFATVPQATTGEVAAAVTAARTALPNWRATSVEDRCALLERVADALAEAYGEEGVASPLKQLIREEVGKMLPEADIEVIESSDMVRFFATQSGDLLVPRTPVLNSELWPTKSSKVIHEPVGVVAVIKAWNYPLELALWAIAPALAAGNTVVFKPSEHASVVGQELVRFFEDAGVPAGVLNLVTGGAATGAALVEHPGVDMVAFTGSAAVGRRIAAHCGSSAKRSSLELGGNDAAIVLADADLELTANGLVWGAVCNTGQVCVGVKRAYVEDVVFDALLDAIETRMRSLQRGRDYGPLISEAQRDRVSSQVDNSVGRGARVVVGGTIIDGPGWFYEPTLLAGVSDEMEVVADECFGPVLPLMRVADIDEAIARANSTRYGLGASVWSSDLGRAQEVARRLDVGMVWVNDVNVAFAEAPWGGVKHSGPGIELGEWGLYEFTNKKHVSLELSAESSRAWWFPYSEADPS